jgi:uncharacterized membrane protein
MRRVPTACLLVMLLGASAITACSDGATATAPTRPTASANASITSSNDAIEAGTFTTIDMPGAAASVAFDINTQGVIVGRYTSAGRTHGWMRTPSGVFTTIDFPGSSFTVAGAVNDAGEIVGWYSLPATPAIRHGFLLRSGVFTSFDPPGSIFTNVVGINDRGDIVGRFCTEAPCGDPGTDDYRGFLLRDGRFTTLDVPGSTETNPWKINNRGDIVGAFVLPDGDVEMFLLRDHAFTTFALSTGAPISEINGGINNRGDIVGAYCDVDAPCSSDLTGTHAFALSGGRLTTIDFPGSLGTRTSAINDRGEVVGSYLDASGVHAYLMRR